MVGGRDSPLPLMFKKQSVHTVLLHCLYLCKFILCLQFCWDVIGVETKLSSWGIVWGNLSLCMDVILYKLYCIFCSIFLIWLVVYSDCVTRWVVNSGVWLLSCECIYCDCHYYRYILYDFISGLRPFFRETMPIFLQDWFTKTLVPQGGMGAWHLILTICIIRGDV